MEKILNEKKRLVEIQGKIDRVKKDFEKAEKANQSSKNWFEKKQESLEAEKEKCLSYIERLEKKCQTSLKKLEKTA